MRVITLEHSRALDSTLSENIARPVSAALETADKAMSAVPSNSRVCLDSAAIAVPRRRGPSLARRTWQQGNVFQKGRLKSDEWLPEAPSYVQFWRDVPGQAQSKREKVPLGVCRTRSIAERRAAEKLEQLGVNSTQNFIESTSSITFKRQSEQWLRSLSARKRNPLEQTTIDTRRYALDKWIYPFLGSRLLGEVNNRAMKELVELMAPKLSPASIRDYTNIVKGVVASAIDENGEELFPRKWNEEYIDAPIVKDQHQPTTDGAGVASILAAATGQYRVLYALLAGCGPLRAGEALGLEIDKHISEDFRTLRVQQKAKRGIIQQFLKTENGIREVDLCTELANLLRDFVGERREGLLFRTSTGAQLLQANTLQDSLHPILKKLEHPKGGFNIFRRYRITELQTAECPKPLQHFWSGHAQTHVSERYIKLLRDRGYRLEWAEKIGMGFKLPTGLPGLLLVMRKSA